MIALAFVILRAVFAPAPIERDVATAIVAAHLESDGDPTTTECPAHRGPRAHHDDSSSATPREPCFCGLWQTTATSAAECRRQRDPGYDFDRRATEIEAWRSQCRRLRAPRRLEDLCAVAGYATGIAGARGAVGGDSSESGVRYARWLFWRAKTLRASL